MAYLLFGFVLVHLVHMVLIYDTHTTLSFYFLFLSFFSSCSRKALFFLFLLSFILCPFFLLSFMLRRHFFTLVHRHLPFSLFFSPIYFPYIALLACSLRVSLHVSHLASGVHTKDKRSFIRATGHSAIYDFPPRGKHYLCHCPRVVCYLLCHHFMIGSLF